MIPWLRRLLTPRTPEPLEPPDPATLPFQDWDKAVKARARLGLKPWPNLPDTDYRNRKLDTCGNCGIPIYGCQGISYGPEGVRCDTCLQEGSSGMMMSRT